MSQVMSLIIVWHYRSLGTVGDLMSPLSTFEINSSSLWKVLRFMVSFTICTFYVEPFLWLWVAIPPPLVVPSIRPLIVLLIFLMGSLLFSSVSVPVIPVIPFFYF